MLAKYIYIKVLNLLMCFQGNDKIVRSASKRTWVMTGCGERAAKAARINILP